MSGLNRIKIVLVEKDKTGRWLAMWRRVGMIGKLNRCREIILACNILAYYDIS